MLPINLKQIDWVARCRQGGKGTPPVAAIDALDSEGLSRFVSTDYIIQNIHKFILANYSLWCAINVFLPNPLPLPYTPPPTTIRAQVLYYNEQLFLQNELLVRIESDILKRAGFDPETERLANCIKRMSPYYVA